MATYKFKNLFSVDLSRMSISSATRSTRPLTKGVYFPASPTDLRSPCPAVNCLANHGYISRDGRNVHTDELIQGMREMGVSWALRAALSKPIFLEHAKISSDEPRMSPSILGKIWYLIRNPWALAFSSFGMRDSDQIDSMGREYLNLDQLALPGVMEHDISLTRHDHQQGDSITVQPDLVRDLLASSSDGGKTLTAEDLSAFRLQRIQQQKRDNPACVYGPREHDIACLSIAMVLQIFGDGSKVPCEYVRVFFLEERLPVQEGWRKRRWWTLGFVELGRGIAKIKKTIGLKFWV